MRLLRLCVASLPLLAFCACQDTFPVTIANPCTTTIEITTYAAPEPHSDAKGTSGTIAGLSAEELPHAFYGDGNLGWSATISNYGNVVPIDVRAVLDDEVVVLPATVCDEIDR
jgi:hypothetical protein